MYEPLGVVRPIRTLGGGPAGGALVGGLTAVLGGAGAAALAPLPETGAVGLLAGGAAGDAQAATSSPSAATAATLAERPRRLPWLAALITLTGVPFPAVNRLPISRLL